MSKKKQKSTIINNSDHLQLELTQKHKLTANQINILKLLSDKQTKILFLDGSPGTAKTYTAVLAGLNALNEGEKSKIIYIRSTVESSSSGIGFIPGGIEEKFSPYAAPLVSKLDEMIPMHLVNKLMRDKVIDVKPVGFLRGESFRDSFVFVDEAQNLTYKELKTLLTRIGKNSIFVVAGDSGQIDIKNSGFETVFEMFRTSSPETRGIFCLKLGKQDIVREGVIKFILDVFERNDNYSKK